MNPSNPSTLSANCVGIDEWPTLRLYQREHGQQAFPVTNLIYLQSETNYTWLHWNDGKRMLMPRTLKFYEPKLPSDFFFRLHRNCVVNARYITGIERNTQGSAFMVLTTGERLPISRRRWSTVKEMVNSYKQAVN